MRYRRQAFIILILTICMVLISAWAGRGIAAPEADEGPIDPPMNCDLGPPPDGITECNHLGEMIFVRPSPETPSRIAGDIAADSGGPDGYGYTWDDSGIYSWVDVAGSTGIDTGMSGSSSDQAVLVTLPFTFYYYENTYTQVWVAGSGYLSFTDNSPDWPGQDPIPLPTEPNNVIAPYWSPFNLDPSGPLGRVYTLSGGTEPDRYFAVEWYEVVDDMDGDDLFDFEVILFENGDIRFQYQTMTVNDSWLCASAGIEEATGLDGLTYAGFCDTLPSEGVAVDFFRPGPSARVKLTSETYGGFGIPGASYDFLMTATNNGDLGIDTFDLTSSSSWPVTFYASDGSTLLTDTDSDAIVDTGSITQDGNLDFVVRVSVPVGAVPGDHDQFNVTASSSLDPSKSDSKLLQTAVSSYFGQAYQKDDDGAMSLLIAQPMAIHASKSTSDGVYGYSPAILETRHGFTYFWDVYRSLGGGIDVNEIVYTLLDKSGQIIVPTLKIDDLSGVTDSTFDFSAAIGRTDSGEIGVVWRRTVVDDATGDGNQNIYFAILDSTGSLVFGPENITQNTVWGNWGDLNVPIFYSPRLTATGDGRFVLVWQESYSDTGGDVDDIYYAIKENNGSNVVGVTKLTIDTPGSDLRFEDPAIASIGPNSVFISWLEYYSNIGYTVLSSNGSIVQSATYLTDDSDGFYDRTNYDAVQLSDGRIMAVWGAMDCFPGEFLERVRYAILDTSYNRVGSPTCLPAAPDSYYGDTDVSATMDQHGNAILTWTDDDWDNRFHLFYTLINGSGGVATPAMSFMNGLSTGTTFVISSEGYGNTTYHPYALYLPLITR